METNTEVTAVETPVVETPVAPAVPAAEPPASPAVPAAEGAPVVEAKVYTPNFKYTVPNVDSKTKEEKEFDDFIKAGIKDEETEKKARDLYTKAHGIESVKKGEEKWRTQATEIGQKYAKINESLNVLSHYVKNGDFDSFFENLKIPQAEIYKWVNKKIQEQEMSPEQRAEVSKQRDLQHRLYALEQQNQSLLERFDTQSVEQNANQLNSVLAKPEYSTLAESFDAKVGKAGAFRDEVIKRGVVLYHLNGQRDLPPEDVVKDFVGIIGKVLETAPAAMGGAPTMGGGFAKPPVLPNVNAKAGSPVKQAPRSIDDLKKLASARA